MALSLTETLPLPDTLTPSKIGKFMSCPLAFRFAYIERLPEPPSVAQVRGTLVHRALQHLYADLDGEERTSEAAGELLGQASVELEGEIATLELNPDERESLERESRALLDHYFQLESPAAVRPVGIELDLRAPLEGIELRGIIDRLDRVDDGRFVLIDYKTGRSPSAERSRSRLIGVQFYAFLCEQTLGIRPSEVRLLYLRDRVVVVESPTDQSMRGLARRALAVWAAIERACSSGDFRPNPSALCRYCAFQQLCPAYAAVSA